MYSWRIKPLKEEPKQMFNIKTDPWFIRVNSVQEFEVIQDWLEENGSRSLVKEPYSSMTYFTNSYDDGSVSKGLILRGRGDPLETTHRKEIKLTFKTTVNSVEYPLVDAPVVKSKEQIKIEELQATIDKACKEIKELRELGENK